MSDVIIGIDLGGTKTHISVQSAAGMPLFDVILPTCRWHGAAFSHKAAILGRLVQQTLRQIEGRPTLRAVAIGAHGCDLADECRELERQLLPYYPKAAWRVVSDVALVALAAGKPRAIGVIAGTGSVAITLTAGGEYISAGGWGWLLGDEGGAGGLVREAIKAALLAHDLGRHDDPLIQQLVTAFQVGHVLDLPAQLMKSPVQEWAQKAQLIFYCEHQGSDLASTVILQAAEALAELVDRLYGRGATDPEVIAAGGVISHQPILFDAFSRALTAKRPETRLALLNIAPVGGALRLAATLL